MKRIHTDGACRGNPGPGGWAWASDADSFASGAAPHTTNQRMEVMAVIEALRENEESPLEIVSDSSYVVKCFNDKWHVGWLRRGWKNSQGKPVANRDLWRHGDSAVDAAGKALAPLNLINRNHAYSTRTPHPVR